MRDLTSRVFYHFEITSLMDVDKMLAYMQRIFRGAALKKYKAVLVECNHLAKELTGDKLTLGALKELSVDNFWTW